MVCIVLSCVHLYSTKGCYLTWPGAPPTTFGLQQILPLVDPEIRDEITRLATFLDTFSKLEIPRCAANLMIFIAMFSSEFCDLEDRDAVTEARTSYIQLLYECLCQTIGVRKSCTVASKLHVMMQNLDRICQILGQKFVNVS